MRLLLLLAAAIVSLTAIVVTYRGRAQPRPTRSVSAAPRSTAGPRQLIASTTSTSTPGPSTGALITPSGVVAPVLGGREGAWLIGTPCGRKVPIERGQFLPSADVVIDAGHGGSEPGATGKGGLVEKRVNLIMAKLVRDHLERRGYGVVLTRTADYRVTLASRAEIAKRLGAHAFVSLHFNAEPDGPSPKPGTETYFQHASEASKRLAGLLYLATSAAMSKMDAQWVADTDAGAKYRINRLGEDYYGILRHAQGVPTSLVEFAFISNPSEERLIGDPRSQSLMAVAVTDGVDRYLATDQPGGGYSAPYARDDAVGGGTEVPPGCIDPRMT